MSRVDQLPHTAPLSLTSAATGQRFSPRRRWWTAFALLSLLGGLWALADPVFSVPDEPAHAVYAAAAVRGELWAPTTGIDTTVTVPATYANASTAAACFIYDGTVPAGCAELFVAQPGTAEVVTTAGRYPPAYYLFAGSATLVADGATAIYLMRFLTVLVCAALLASAFLSVSERRSPWPLTGLVFACTPMVLFFTGAVNPQGPELAAGIALWASALALFPPPGPTTERDDARGVAPRLVLRCLFAMAALALIRPLSVVWLGLIVGVVLLARATGRRLVGLLRDRWMLLGGLAVAAMVVMTAVWVLARDALRQWSRPVDMPVPDAALVSVSKLDGELAEMVGVFGWLDNSAPGLVHLLWIGAVAVLAVLAAAVGTRRERLALLAVVAISVVMPVVSELSSYRESAFAWQGRYILAFSAGLTVLSGYVLADRFPDEIGRRVCRGLVVAAGVAHLVAFVGNLNRYVHGIDSFWFLGEPGWRPPLPAWLLIAAFAVVTAVAVAGLLRQLRDPREPAAMPAVPAG
jgi:hypothetical protein